MNIDKYKKTDENGFTAYYDENDTCYMSAEQFLQIKILDFCFCGDPESNLKYVGKALQVIDKSRGKGYKYFVKLADELFRNSRAAYFMFYFLDSKELTEHGSSLSGWLTQKGKEFLEDVIELFGIEEINENNTD